MQNLIEKQKSLSMYQLKRLQKVADIRDSRIKTQHQTRNKINRQLLSNYNNESDRIRGEMAHLEVKGLSSTKLKQRLANLNKLRSEIHLF